MAGVQALHICRPTNNRPNFSASCHCTTLQQLRLNQCYCSTLDASGLQAVLMLPSLKSLDLSGNYIPEMPLQLRSATQLRSVTR